WDVYGRQYNAVTGVATGDEFLLSSGVDGDQVHPAWAANDAGNAVAVWSGSTFLATNGNSNVLEQQFDVSAGDDLNDLSVDNDFALEEGLPDPQGEAAPGGQQAATAPAHQVVNTAATPPAAQDT